MGDGKVRKIKSTLTRDQMNVIRKRKPQGSSEKWKDILGRKAEQRN
jgi:hypothetical protein